MNVHDRLHSIMTSVILCCSVYKCCRCPRVSPASQKSCLSLSWPCWAGLGWAGLGWAGLGWAGLGWVGAVSGLAVSSPGPAKMAAVAVSWRSAEQRAALLSVLSGHYIVTCCTQHPHTLPCITYHPPLYLCMYK